MKLISKFFIGMLLIMLCTNCNETKKNNSTIPAINASQKHEASLLETKWKLVELMGKAVISENKKEVNITFSNEANRVAGFAGCNSFGGTYEIRDSSNISFGSMISTKMACPDLDNENVFFDVLKNTNSYYINEDTLSFTKAKATTLAKFVAENK